MVHIQQQVTSKVKWISYSTVVRTTHRDHKGLGFLSKSPTYKPAKKFTL